MKTTIIIILFVLAGLFWLVNRISGGYLVGVLKWRFSPRQWTGRRVYIMGKMRVVTGETYEYFFVKGLSHEIRKDNRYLRADAKRK